MGLAGNIYDATWGRLFATWYDRALEKTEEAALREIRRKALAPARGRTIDLGAGTGVNLELFPETVTELVMAEPDRHMAKQLLAKQAHSERKAELVEAPAEKLPFEDSSFDTVVCTLVLCTVPDPAAALAEAARILKPDGRLLFVEHVRSPHDARLARWQDRLEKPWRFIGDGCHCNRDTLASIEASFNVESVEDDWMDKAPIIVRPLVRGSAALAA